MIRAYDDNGNVVDLVAWKKQIRANLIDELFWMMNSRMSLLKDLAEEEVRKNNKYHAHYLRGSLWELGMMCDELEKFKEENNE